MRLIKSSVHTIMVHHDALFAPTMFEWHSCLEIMPEIMNSDAVNKLPPEFNHDAHEWNWIREGFQWYKQNAGIKIPRVQRYHEGVNDYQFKWGAFSEVHAIDPTPNIPPYLVPFRVEGDGFCRAVESPGGLTWYALTFGGKLWEVDKE